MRTYARDPERRPDLPPPSTGVLDRVRAPARPLEEAAHGGAQPRFAHDFSQVRVASPGAAPSGVLMRQAAPAPAAPAAAAAPTPAAPAAPTYGTSNTTSPVAKNSIKPQNLMLGELAAETGLFASAQVIVDWAKKKQAPAPAAAPAAGAQAQPADAVAFSAAELFADTATIKKLKPLPTSEAELKPTLDLLVDYGVLRPPVFLDLSDPDPKYMLVTDKDTGAAATGAFDTSKAEISAFEAGFKKRVDKDDPLASVVSIGQIDTAWSSDLTQVKKEKKAEETVADLKAQLGEYLVILPAVGKAAPRTVARAATDTPTPVVDKKGKTVAWEIPVVGQKKPARFTAFDKVEKVADGTDPATVKHRAGIEAAIKKAEKELRTAGRYRTFADEVIVLLTRLRKRNTTWSAGTYVGHSWAEFSADIFLRTGFDAAAPGFWKRDVVRTFFADLNASAEEDDGVVGKFAWRAIYNDQPLRTEMNTLYGADRVLTAPGHGPDKLHIHLDLTPLSVKKDAVTGYEIVNGRVRLLKP